MAFRVIDCDPNGSVVGKQPPKELKSAAHQGEPYGVLKSVVIVLKRTASIVRRVNEDAFDLAGEFLFERLEGKQIVAEDEAIIEHIVVSDAMRGVV